MAMTYHTGPTVADRHLAGARPVLVGQRPRSGQLSRQAVCGRRRGGPHGPYPGL